MNPRDLVNLLNRIKCWIPESKATIRDEIDQVISHLKKQL